MHDNHSARRVPASRVRIPPTSALLAFEAAARLLSFRRAAEELGLTASAVSHQLGSLEAQLGERLFSRVGRSVRLTPAGERFAHQVRRGLAAINRGLDDLATDAQTRQIRLSASALFSQTVLVPHLRDFARRWPHYDLRLEVTARMVDFNIEQVDAGIRIGRGPWPGLTRTRLLTVRGLPAASPSFLEAHPVTTPADFLRLPLIHNAFFPSAWPDWFAIHGLSIEDHDAGLDVTLDSLPISLEAAQHGVGAVLTMDPLVRSHPGFGTTLIAAIDPPASSELSFWLVHRIEAGADPKIKALTHWLRDAVQAIPAKAPRTENTVLTAE